MARRDLAAVALREAEEESGLRDLEVLPTIFDLDRHLIPARGDEPAHWHYDVRYVVLARGDEAFTVNEESLALAWRPVSDIAADPSSDDSLRRMASKWLALRAKEMPRHLVGADPVGDPRQRARLTKPAPSPTRSAPTRARSAHTGPATAMAQSAYFAGAGCTAPHRVQVRASMER